MKAHGAGTLVRGNDAQSEVTKRLSLDISVCMVGLNYALLAKRFELRDNLYHKTS